MRSKLDLTSRIKVTATMMFCTLIVSAAGVDSWRLSSHGVAASVMFLDGSIVYTPIPSIFIGVRRLQLVEFWRTCSYCYLSDVAGIPVCYSISI